MDQTQTKAKILIVEDDVFMASLLERKFKQESYEILKATTTDQAKDILKANKANIILLDVMLPGKDGITYLKELKADQNLKDIPVIITSNLGQQEEIERGMQEGASDYIVKAHATPGEIVQKVEEILGAA